jgi:hypothetical protein
MTVSFNTACASIAYAREKQEEAYDHSIRALLGALQPLASYGPRYIQEKVLPCETCDRIDTCDGTGCNKRWPK